MYYLAAQVAAQNRFFPHIFVIIDILPVKYIMKTQFWIPFRELLLSTVIRA